MQLSKELKVLVYLFNLVICANLLFFARNVPETTQLQNGIKTLPSEASSPNSLQLITVQCDEAEMVIQIHRDLFQTGYFIQAKDLSIGPQACQYSVVNESASFIVFKIEVHECGYNLQTSDSLFYNASLYYKPDSASKAVTVKSPVEIPITCHYPWKNNVSNNAIQTTWVPLTSAMSEEGRQYFSLRLMTEDWQAERVSAEYLLGDDLHVQADIGKGNHLPLRLFIDTCMVTPDGDSDPHSKILDFHGCLIDGTSHDVKPSFIIPRPQLETLQFTIPASQIAGDERSFIYISCHLKVTEAAKEPDLLNKACSFSRQRKVWLPVEGSMEICNCCETKDCDSHERHKSNDTSSLHVPSQRKQMPSETAIIDISKGETEADLVVGPILIQKAAKSHQRDQIRTEEMLEEDKEGEFPVIETEADSIVGHRFILKTDKALIWLVNSNETMKDELLDMIPDNETDEQSSGSGSLDLVTLPWKVVETTLNDAPVKGTTLGQALTITTEILLLFLFSGIV